LRNYPGADLDQGASPGYVTLLEEFPALPESQRAAFPRNFARMKNGTLIPLILLLLFAFAESRPSEEKSMKPTRNSAAEPAFTNRLIHETSPYLRQHAHNPVDWYPWGEEALEKARREDKPILLSIGYSACHWCHVMERESFENEGIAQVMNAHFVNIKVDREERPDLDTLYMNYVQMTTGSGGWPMTVFLTPEEIPFFGGTYFPPDDRFGRPGFGRLCQALAEAYREKREEIEARGPEILQRLEAMNTLPAGAATVTGASLDQAFDQLAPRFDLTHGGFSGTPKFPGSMSLTFLLRHFSRTGRREGSEFVALTLEKMARGGMYDQLGGGFHRYSVDERWLVPHFEKMLYDNALLSRLYLEAYQLDPQPLYARVVEEILDYVVREMLNPQGGFYSTQDADSEGHEGKFFVWTPTEVGEILGEEASKAFCRYYDVTDGGNFEGSNILNVPRPLEQVAGELSLSPAELAGILSEARERLFREREKRVKPHRDEKILTGWNGMMSVSFVEASVVLQRADYLEVARRNARFLLEHLCRGDRIFRTHKDGVSKLPGYLDDYANLVEHLLALYQATGEREWLDQAVLYNDAMLEQFWDREQSIFFLTGKEHEQLLTPVRDAYDNATPAGSSVAVFNLLKLAILTGNPEYRSIAETNLETMHLPLTRYPNGFGYLLGAADFYLGPVKEIAVVGDPQSDETRRLLEVVHRQFLPNKVVALLDPNDAEGARELPLLEGKTLVKGRPAAYVCENYTCKAPVTEPGELELELGVKR